MMATDPPTTSTARPRFVRPKDDRVISGVCAGLARHLGLDTALVRTVAVILTLIGGVGLLVYLAALVLVPEEGAAQPFVRSGSLDDDDRAPLILGALVLGAVVMGAGPLPWDPWDGGPWLVILAVGIGLVVLATRHDRRTDTVTAAAPMTAAVATPQTPPQPAAPADEAPTLVGPAAPAPQPPRRPRSPQARIVLGVVLLLLGGLGLALSTFGVDLGWESAVSIVVLVLGAGAVAAAPFGGARSLLLAGFAVAAIGGFLAATDLDLDGGIGERREHPTAVSAFPSDGYRLGIGDQRVDLTDVAFPFGTTTLKVRQGIGEMRVLIPAGVAVVARGRATGGELRILGRREEGGNPDLEVESPVRSDRRLVVDAEVTFGEIRIEQHGVDEGTVR